MTDEQILQTIREIMDKLHDPKDGFNGFRNDLKAQKLSQDEYKAALYAKGAEMTEKYGLANADPDEQKFRVSGEDIVKNRFYASCGNAAKAFCYHNSQLPPERRLDIKILLSTDPEHLIDGMVGHTLPCVKMSDGKYHAVEPQINPNKGEYIIKGDIEVGKNINHILPSIAEKGRPYYITRIVSPEYHEKELSDFSVFLDQSVVRKGKTGMIAGKLKLMMQQLNLGQYERNSRRIYEFCNNLRDSKIPVAVFNYREDGKKTDILYLAVQLDGNWYGINTSHSYLKLHKTEDLNKGPYGNDKIHLEQQMSPAEYMQYYNTVISPMPQIDKTR